MPLKTVFYNARVITPFGILDRGGIVISDQKIVDVFEGKPHGENTLAINCNGHYLSSGFIDLHIHGAGGEDFMNATPKAVQVISSLIAEHGTTGYLATTLSAARKDVERALDNINCSINTKSKGANVLGVHLESNYFSMGQKGAQNPEFIYPPRPEEYENFLSRAPIKIISAAPEIPGVLGMAHDLSSRGICMSMGHTCADYYHVSEGVAAGFTHATHVYNGMSIYSNTNYYPTMGTSESIMDHEEITVEVIADGKHISPAMLRFIYKIKGAERMHAVTDAVMACMPEGSYNLGGLSTIVTDGVCMLSDRTSFAGSTATTDRLLRVLYKEAGIPLIDAVKMLTSTPARIIGLCGKKGRIAIGYDADINVFNESIEIQATMIEGIMFRNTLEDAIKYGL